MKSINICQQCALRGNCIIRINFGDAWAFEPIPEDKRAVCAYFMPNFMPKDGGA